MLTLTREIRMTLHAGDIALAHHGLWGNTVDGPGMFLSLQVTLSGDLDARSQYIENIKVIDERVHDLLVPSLNEAYTNGTFTGARAVQLALAKLALISARAGLVAVRLAANPYLYWEARVKESPMVRLTHRFEFSAAHRLHNPSMDEAENRLTFGKCNNPEGHGHNYEFEVTVQGEPDANGQLIPMSDFQRIVNQTVTDRFDHKFLNRQTEEFAATIPSVENIAIVIYRLLKDQFSGRVALYGVRVWETGKTFAECSG